MSDNGAPMGRRGLLLLCLALLAACGARDDAGPFTDSRLPAAISQADWAPVGWTWGLIQPTAGAAPQRYGVAAPATEPRAQLLLLPRYGDFAETHYRQLNAFVGQYYVSWALDGAGQGGSGRLFGPRDLGHVDAFDNDEAAIHALIQHAVRPSGAAPLVLVAEGTAAAVALQALRSHPEGVAGVVLVEPTLRAPMSADPRLTAWAPRLRLGFIRAPGGSGWRHDAATPDVKTDSGRRLAWQIANPDLRMGDPSLGWLAAFDDLVAQTTPQNLARISAPVLILSAHGGADPDWAPLCRAMPHCTLASEAKPSTPQVIAFTEGFVRKGAPTPHPLSALSNDDLQR